MDVADSANRGITSQIKCYQKKWYIPEGLITEDRIIDHSQEGGASSHHPLVTLKNKGGQ